VSGHVMFQGRVCLINRSNVPFLCTSVCSDRAYGNVAACWPVGMSLCSAYFELSLFVCMGWICSLRRATNVRPIIEPLFLGCLACSVVGILSESSREYCAAASLG
jgi:hypothetical protein